MDSTDTFLGATNRYQNTVEVPSLGTLDECQQNRIGDCHIFNFKEYHKNMELGKRDGSKKDVTELKQVFSCLNFNVYTYGTADSENLSKSQTIEAIHNAANKMRNRPGKYLVCCIMTHGNKSDALAAYDQWLSLDEILDACSNAIGKNQIIFFIQACRSDELKLEKLVAIESTDFGHDEKFYSDVLVARSTYRDTVSMRSDGTYFIQEICHTFKNLKGKINLFEVLTVVNFRMAYFFETRIKGKIGGQMPIFESTLTSEILFDAINSCSEPNGESLLDQKLRGVGLRIPLSVNDISNLQYNITPENVNFFNIKIKHQGSSEIKEAAAHLNSVLKNSYPRVKSCEVSEMKDVMKRIKESAEKRADCVFCLISGPSSYGSLCDTDGRKIYQKNIIDYFIKKQKEHLVSKPKIFLFLMFESVSESSSPVESKESGDSCDGGNSFVIAQHADILEINIIVKSKNEKDIHTPVEAMKNQLKDSRDQDFLSILTKVNSELCKDKFLINGNNFCFNSTLTQKLVLPK